MAYNQGYQVWVRGTTPAGSGSNLIDVSLDGNVTSITRQSNGSAVYDEIYFASPILKDDYHAVVITNRGSAQEGYTDFELDRFEFDTDDEIPLFKPPTSSIASVDDTPVSTSSSQPTKSANSPGVTKKDPPIGAIVGGVVGGIAVMLAVFLLIWRKRRHNSNRIAGSSPPLSQRTTLTATPFPVEPSTEPPDWVLGRPISGKEATFHHVDSVQTHNGQLQVEPSGPPTDSAMTSSPISPPSSHDPPSSEWNSEARPPPAYHN